jgi:thymidylate kinase
MRDTFTVAIIGADGAGKTTVAREVADVAPVPVKYVYMGMNPQANRYALPTSRISYWIKHRAYLKRHPEKRWGSRRKAPDLGHIPQQRGPVLAAARLVNRLVEEWVRQLLVWRSRRRGYIVICDRHFVIDFGAHRTRAKAGDRLTDRIHRWMLARIYPHPELVIFLNAPAELLFERKPDASVDYLRARQRSFAASEATWPNFRTVDATRPLRVVIDDVVRHILDYRCARSHSVSR